MKRAIIIVLDSVGIGELPDAADFGDVAVIPWSISRRCVRRRACQIFAP